MKENLFVENSAREKVMEGIRKCALAVGGTMGTSGTNALIEAIESPGFMTTNDGWTILNAIRFEDELEEIGRKILVEAVNRANKLSGDGSSTTTVLTNAILECGQDHLWEVSPMEIKRSLEECVPVLERAIDGHKREIEIDEVGAVATISAEDAGIGEMIQEIYSKIGRTGIVHWDVSKTAHDSYTVGSGITVSGATYMSPYMCDADEKGQNTGRVRIVDPYIMLTRQKIASAGDFETVAVALAQKDIKDLVVFCDEVDPLVISSLTLTRMQRGFRILLIKMPTLWKDWWYEDLAIATGATLVDSSSGVSLKTIKLEHLGRCSLIVVDKQDTHLDGIKDVSAHIDSLMAEGSEDSQLRASHLNTKTARYFVGAYSDSALAYRRLKVEDAIAAAYHALNGGIVAGGGVIFRQIREVLPETVGGDILRKALEYPFLQIARNAGKDPRDGAFWLKALTPETWLDVSVLKGSLGLDTKTLRVVDMFKAQITDPASITKNSIRNAIGVAASVLSCGTTVTLPRGFNQASHDRL